MTSQPQIAPVPLLAADVNCFWSLEQDQALYNREAVAPDSYSEVVINVGAPMFLETDNGLLALPRAFVNPIQHTPLRFRAAGYCQLISMKLYPWAVRPILNIEANPSNVHVIGLNADWQRFAEDLAQIVAHRGYEEATYAFQDYVCKIAYHDTDNAVSVTSIRAAGHLMRRTQGQIRMTDLAAQSYLSASQFERRFKHYTAVSPKTYARIIRFEAVRAALILAPSSRLADLANEFGYSDQAHLTHEFKAFAASTPGDFAALSNDEADLQKYERWRQFQNRLTLAVLTA